MILKTNIPKKDKIPKNNTNFNTLPLHHLTPHPNPHPPLQSSYCSTSGDNPIKFYLPIIVVVLAVLTFVVVLVSWYKAKDASDTEYHYIGSTYTVYETWEPTLTASKAPIETAIVPVAAPVSNHCCKSGESNPIYIVNQPTNPQPMPVNVMVPPQPMPMIPMVPMVSGRVSTF